MIESLAAAVPLITTGSVVLGWFGQYFFNKALDEVEAGTKTALQGTTLENLVAEFDTELLRDEQADFIDKGKLDSFVDKYYDDIRDCVVQPTYWQRQTAIGSLANDACEAVGAKTIAQRATVARIVRAFIQQTAKLFGYEGITVADDATGTILSSIKDGARAVNERFDKLEAQHKALLVKGTFAEFIDTRTRGNAYTETEFHYRNKKYAFYGREEELSRLEKFIELEKPLSIWAVTGPGGVGKSRLLLEFVKTLDDDPSWRALFMPRGETAKLDEWTIFDYDRNVLLVFDYAGYHPDDLGKWLNRLVETSTERRPKKLRVLLIEREKVTGGAEKMPYWLGQIIDGGERACAKAVFYKTANGIESLHVGSLADAKSMELVKGYAEKNAIVLNEADAEKVLAKAKDLDQKLGTVRPLFLLFLTDALINREDFESWDREQAVAWVIGRQEERYLELCKKDETQANALAECVAYATATGPFGLDENSVPEGIAKKVELLRAAHTRDFGLWVRAVTESSGDDWPSLEPDIIGELYVLLLVRNKLRNYQEHYARGISLSYWGRASWFQYVGFLGRCLAGWHNEFTRELSILTDLSAGDTGTADMDILTVHMSALVNLTAYQDADGAEKTVACLEKLAQDHESSEEIALEFAKGLFNLSCEQDETGAKATVERLEKLADDHEDSEEIALCFAQGLFNLSCEQDETGAKATVERLEKLEPSLIDRGFSSFTAGNVQTGLDYFFIAHQIGNIVGSNNLAYILRRYSSVQDQIPLILERPLAQGDPFALVNYALYLAQFTNDWLEADRQLEKINNSSRGCEGIIEWWGGLSQKGDVEGFLVLLWLSRHGLFEEAKTGLLPALKEAIITVYPETPEWLFEKYSSPESNNETP
jgi:hypothetical protein